MIEPVAAKAMPERVTAKVMPVEQPMLPDVAPEQVGTGSRVEAIMEAPGVPELQHGTAKPRSNDDRSVIVPEKAVGLRVEMVVAKARTRGREAMAAKITM